VIEALITHLVREAPTFDPDVVEKLVLELEATREPLARSIARVLELVVEQLVDPGVALPALAMACATLVDPRSSDAVFEAARYEIDTLLPLPDKIIPATALRRR
jgi:hypothetical protein